MFSRILIATDGSDVAAAAVLVGTGLARALNAALALVHVVDPSLAATTAEGISASELLDDLRREGAARPRDRRGGARVGCRPRRHW